MKKALTIILGAMLMLVVSACNQTAEPVEKDGKTETTKKEQDLTLEEVYKKVEEANKDIKSFESNITMNQKVDAGGEKQEIKSDMAMEFIMEPMTLHQKMTMSIGEEKQELDAYLTKDGFYVYEPNQKTWLKLPSELSSQILQMSEGQTNPSEQLNQLKQFVDDFEFKQDEKSYILTLKASGEKFDQFLKDNVKATMPPDMQDEAAMSDVTFNQVDYELFIDKETFYLTALNMVTDMDTDVNGQKMNMNLDMKSTYSNYNKVESIEVPKEALENAQEVNLNEMGGQ
ncbi:outer membrane lipoprotein-sorting protein [Bacillus thermophilus]|uniref:Outer membrane lipoprotein-sorting protein n=1 Tax=Siminovitchia thermophila TaxID=1245522 RepID=A0ABS2RAC9_9BACI|nr:DUF6612 family protein [Siminovitchia thermophila]MBM7716590.1 outer membrane lipoprotein-sorting protein [Siminovitchia thermophila]